MRSASPSGTEGAPAEAPDPLAPATAPATLYCNLGDVLNLAVAQGSYCRFTRISPFGLEGMAQKLAERRQLTLEHCASVAPARRSDDSGRAGRRATPRSSRRPARRSTEGVAKLVDELRLSLEYYGTQDGSVAVESVVACGPGTIIPGLVERLQETVGYPFAIGRPAALAGLDDVTAARLTLSYGLALEE